MKIQKHYAWLVCFACMMLFFCGIGFSTTAISVYFPFLKEHMNLTNTQVSMITTCRTFSSTIAMLLAGAFYKRVSLRKGTFFAMLCLVAARLLFAFAPNVGFYYIAAAFMGITYSWGVMYPVMIILNNWFEDRYATAAGIATCGSGICTILMPPIVTWGVEHVGLRTTFLVEGGFVLALAIVLFLIIRDNPEEKGLARYTEAVKGKEKTRKASDIKSYPGGFEMLLLGVGVLLVGIVAAPSTANYAIHYSTEGFGSAIIATAMSVYGLSNFGGKLLIGNVEDRFKTFYVNLMFIGIWIISSTVTAFAGSAAMIMAASVLNGLGTPMATLGVGTWSRELASPEDYRKVYSRNQSIFTVGSLIGSPIPGMLADITGTYKTIYLIFTAMLVVTVILLSLIYFRHTAWGTKKAAAAEMSGSLN